MSLPAVIVLLAGAALGGYSAWRLETKTMFYRSANSTIRPPDVALEDYEQWVLRRRKRWRALKAVLFGAVGAAVAGVLFVMIDSGLSRR
jgi:hypothetical protein